MLILGVDPGSTTGFAILEDDDGLRILHAWSAELERAGSELQQALNAWTPDVVAVEGWELMGAQLMRGACEQAWMAGVLVGWLRALGWEPVVLGRSPVKTALRLRRNSNKAAVRGALAGRVTDVSRCLNSHELDAAAVAYAASVMNRQGLSVKDAIRGGQDAADHKI